VKKLLGGRLQDFLLEETWFFILFHPYNYEQNLNWFLLQWERDLLTLSFMCPFGEYLLKWTHFCLFLENHSIWWWCFSLYVFWKM